MKIIFLIPLLFFISCSHNLVVSTHDCSERIRFYHNQSLFDFEVTDSFWVGSEKKIQVCEFLKEKNIDPKNVESLEIITKKDGWDAFLSLMPFVSHQTIIVKGRFHKTTYVTEDKTSPGIGP